MIEINKYTIHEEQINKEKKKKRFPPPLPAFPRCIIHSRAEATMDPSPFPSPSPSTDQEPDDFEDEEDEESEEEEGEGLNGSIDLSDLKSTPSKALRVSLFKDRIFVFYSGKEEKASGEEKWGGKWWGWIRIEV